MHNLLTIVPLFGGPGLMELLLIGGAVLLVFGAAKLPKLGKGIGEGIRNFKTGLKGEKKQSTEMKKEDKKKGDSTESHEEKVE